MVAFDLLSAPAVTVELDDKRISNVSLAPHTANLGELLEGEHILDFTV